MSEDLTGRSVSRYRVLSKLGEGGMGVVYRATDPELDRDVAIKVLPPSFTEDPDRLSRFAREAQLLAQLHHPNIASVFGLEDAGGSRALVMELVEGPTLDEYFLAERPGLEESLEIARQIAEALEAAHAKGIVHRDLKPQNVKVTDEGRVKVLDFGLAKAMDPDGGASDSGSASRLAASPTLTLGATAQGMILGTAGYMAPEQAKGKGVDKRADIWAFGVVLWEMLVGKPLFEGDSVPETLAGVLKSEIDLGELPPETPPPIRRLLGRCLQRQPRERLHDIADARIVLEEVLRGDATEVEVASSTGPAGVGRAALVMTALVAALLAAGATWWVAGRGTMPESRTSAPVRLSVALTEEVLPTTGWPGKSLDLSSNGRTLVWACRPAEWKQLCVRSLDHYSVEKLPGARDANQPFFSPDGRWVGYFEDEGGLKKISLETGQVIPVVPQIDVAIWGFGSWGDDGRIVFAAWNSGLRSVSSDGGEVTTLVPAEEEWIDSPHHLPGATAVLFRVRSSEGTRIDALELETGERLEVLAEASHPIFVPPDRLVFARDGVTMSARFDPDRLEVIGPAKPLAEQVALDSVWSSDPLPQLAVARDGTLAFFAPRTADPMSSRLVWTDRRGEEIEAISLPGAVWSLDLDASDRLAVVAVRERGRIEYQVVDLERGTTTLVANGPGEGEMTTPTLLPGGKELAFVDSVVETVSVRIVALDGGGTSREIASLPGSYAALRSTSPDGEILLFSAYRPGRWSDIWSLDRSATDPKPVPFLATPASEFSPRMSPDGRWVAYVSNESGDDAVYLASFPGASGKTRVSIGSGRDPIWRSDGRELFFVERGTSARGKLFSVAVEAGDEVRIGEPVELFEVDVSGGGDISRHYDVSADGERFLFLTQQGIGRSLSAAQDRDLFDLRVVTGAFARIDGPSSGD